jgi:hypothetical protein
MKKLGGRKYLFLWAVFAVASVAMFIKLATFPEWTVVVLAEMGYYFAANEYQKYVEKKYTVMEGVVK